MNSNYEKVEELRWKKFPVLDDGFVCLVDVMGDDAAVTQAARVSYGKDLRDGETTVKADDRTLIRYLLRHRHTTPLEMVEVKFLVRVPMDCWRQWIRHRMASVNEYSTRYTEAIDSCQTTPADQWRLQSGTNKQGSGGFLQPLGESSGIAENLTRLEAEFHENARKLYEHRLNCGIAREQARKDLPLSTYTEAYWKIDLHNLLHFLGLRMDSHAQLEIRSYANVIGKIIEELFPITWEAFLDYRFNAMSLSALDQRVIASLMAARDGFGPEMATSILDRHFSNKREREECAKKLSALGFCE